jgi:chitinase
LNAFIADAKGLGTILDDDDAPLLSINDVALTEGNAGSKNAVFDVTLSAVSGRDVTVAWTTNALSAAAGQDFVAASGSLDFPAGTSSRSVTIAIAGDALDEPNETFTVDLSSPSHASLDDGQGLCTIINDDSTLPGLSIADASIVEGNAGTVILSLPVTLSAPSAQQVQVNYQTLDDMAVSNGDFQATNGTLTFSAGQTQKTVDITVNADVLDELDETLYVTLSGAVNAFLADGVGLGTILNDDTEPSLSIDDVTLAEGNTGKKNATFTISLSAVSGIPVGVSYATADGSAVEAGTASSGQDDYDAASDIVFIPAGQSSVQISVPINGDTLTETLETFQVILSAPQNATLADDTGQCNISNDDALPSIAINDVAAPEGDAGTKAFTFSLTLSAASGDTVSVDFATANGTAFSGQDYNAGSGTVVFAPGQTTATLDVMVLGDTAVEGHKDETFSVTLTNAQGATLSDALGAGTIQDDD